MKDDSGRMAWHMRKPWECEDIAVQDDNVTSELALAMDRIHKMIELADSHGLSFSALLRSADVDPQISKDAEAILRSALRQRSSAETSAI